MNNAPNQTTAIQRVDKSEKALEFVPFGSQEKVKLSIKIVKDICAVPTKSGRTCSDRDALKFMMLCHAKGLNPFEGDAYLVGYDSNVPGVGLVPTYSQITAHQAFLKRAELHDKYEGMPSGIIVQREDGTLEEREGDFHLRDEVVVGGWAKVYRSDRKFPTYRRVRLDRFDTGFAEWKKDPAGMIVKCAEADALRSAFPTKIGGMYSAQEMSKVLGISTDAPEISTDRLIDLAPAPSSPAATVSAPPKEDDNIPFDKPAAAEPTRQAAAAPVSGGAPAARAGSAVAELAQWLASEGFTFNHLQRWGMDTNNIPGADSMATIDEVPAKDAQRLLRSKTGMKTALAEIKAKGD